MDAGLHLGAGRRKRRHLGADDLRSALAVVAEALPDLDEGLDVLELRVDHRLKQPRPVRVVVDLGIRDRLDRRRVAAEHELLWALRR